MQNCSFCSVVSGMFKRAMCISSRRGSSDSYYRELGDQETLKIEDKSSTLSDDSDDIVQEVTVVVTQAVTETRTMPKNNICLDRFQTMHRRRKKLLLTRSLIQDAGLLDDLQYGQVQRILQQAVEWKFNAFALENVSGGRCLPMLSIHLFHVYGLISHFQLDVVKIWKLLSLIEEGYHSNNPYHNAIHATDVTQAMHCFLQQEQIRMYMTPVEIMASLLAAIAHDIDHPGVNQAFLLATSNHLAALYKNQSVLENHHWRAAISCINESRLLEGFDLRDKVESQISSLILATDITMQHEYLNQFKSYLDNNTLDLRKSEHRHLVLQIALKCADISNPCRSWEISKMWSLKVCEEFFRQGDYEKELKLPVTALCDRSNTSIPEIQAGFLRYIAVPLIHEWHRFLQNELSTQMLENLMYNQEKWETLAAKELEMKTEVAGAHIVDDDIETCSATNISDSSELLLPLRRSSLNPARPVDLKDQLRRFSAPLNVFQDTKFKIKEKRRSDFASLIRSELSIHSHCESDITEKISTEKLLPDSSIASITTPIQATKINNVIKRRGFWKLVRQQTFPPMESITGTHGLVSRPKFTSNEDEIFLHGRKADLSLTYATEMDIYSEIEYVSDDDINVAGAIEVVSSFTEDPMMFKETMQDSASTAHNQLRDNFSAVQLTSAGESPHRRQSMSAEIVACAQKEKKPVVIPRPIQRAISGINNRRRGSAPAPVAVNDLRSLASSWAAPHSVNGGRRNSPVMSCQQSFAKVYGDQEHKYLPRRSSLPAEAAFPPDTCEDDMKKRSLVNETILRYVSSLISNGNAALDGFYFT